MHSWQPNHGQTEIGELYDGHASHLPYPDIPGMYSHLVSELEGGRLSSWGHNSDQFRLANRRVDLLDMLHGSSHVNRNDSCDHV